MTRKSCAVGIRNAILRNYLNSFNSNYVDATMRLYLVLMQWPALLISRISEYHPHKKRNLFTCPFDLITSYIFHFISSRLFILLYVLCVMVNKVVKKKSHGEVLNALSKTSQGFVFFIQKKEKMKLNLKLLLKDSTNYRDTLYLVNMALLVLI